MTDRPVAQSVHLPAGVVTPAPEPEQPEQELVGIGDPRDARFVVPNRADRRRALRRRP